MDDVNGADFFHVKTPRTLQAPLFRLRGVRDFAVSRSRHVADQQIASISEKDL
jgi:hypothetical protein